MTDLPLLLTVALLLVLWAGTGGIPNNRGEPMKYETVERVSQRIANQCQIIDERNTEIAAVEARINKLEIDAVFLANVWNYCKAHFSFAFTADIDVEGIDFVANRVLGKKESA